MESNGYRATTKVTARNVSHAVNRESNTGSRAREEMQVPIAIQKDPTLETMNLIEHLCSDDNLNNAYKRVYANKGAPGIDNMTVYQLKDWLTQNREQLKEQLMNGKYSILV